MQKAADDNSVLALIRAIIRDDAAEVAKLLRASPSLARQALALGASRDRATDFYFKEIPHYLYAGDTALHAAAAAYRHEIARALIKEGADAFFTVVVTSVETVGPFDSLVGATAVLEEIVAAVLARLGPRAQSRMQSLEQLSASAVIGSGDQ